MERAIRDLQISRLDVRFRLLESDLPGDCLTKLATYLPNSRYNPPSGEATGRTDRRFYFALPLMKNDIIHIINFDVNGDSSVGLKGCTNVPTALRAAKTFVKILRDESIVPQSIWGHNVRPEVHGFFVNTIEFTTELPYRFNSDAMDRHQKRNAQNMLPANYCPHITNLKTPGDNRTYTTFTVVDFVEDESLLPTKPAFTVVGVPPAGLTVELGTVKCSVANDRATTKVSVTLVAHKEESVEKTRRTSRQQSEQVETGYVCEELARRCLTLAGPAIEKAKLQ